MAAPSLFLDCCIGANLNTAGEDRVLSQYKLACGHAICATDLRQLRKTSCPVCGAFLEGPLVTDEILNLLVAREQSDEADRLTQAFLLAERTQQDPSFNPNEHYGVYSQQRQPSPPRQPLAGYGGDSQGDQLIGGGLSPTTLAQLQMIDAIHSGAPLDSEVLEGVARFNSMTLGRARPAVRQLPRPAAARAISPVRPAAAAIRAAPVPISQPAGPGLLGAPTLPMPKISIPSLPVPIIPSLPVPIIPSLPVPIIPSLPVPIIPSLQPATAAPPRVLSPPPVQPVNATPRRARMPLPPPIQAAGTAPRLPLPTPLPESQPAALPMPLLATSPPVYRSVEPDDPAAVARRAVPFVNPAFSVDRTVFPASVLPLPTISIPALGQPTFGSAAMNEMVTRRRQQ